MKILKFLQCQMRHLLLHIIVVTLLHSIVVDAQAIQPAAVSRASVFPQFPQSIWQRARSNDLNQLSAQQSVRDDLQQLYAQNLLLTRGCPTRPSGCSLNCGSGGFAWGLGAEDGGATCLCVCQTGGCSNAGCSRGEVCVDSANSSKCVSTDEFRHQFLLELRRQQLETDSIQSHAPSCPRLQGGTCRQRCRVDADCHKKAGASLAQLRSFLRCCSNGCGRECVLAAVTASSIKSLAITASAGAHFPSRSINGQDFAAQPITPLGHSIKQQQHLVSFSQKPGMCPSSTLLRLPNGCVSECELDAECEGAEKCCGSGCGRICTAPEKTSNCVHLLSAVERLSSRTLAGGFVPSCSPRGSFNPVQCDLESCWCATRETGNEIYGTKRPRHERALLNCKDIYGCEAAVERCARKSRNCPMGFRTDENGCPQADCACRDLCDSVLCENAVDECQLIEPDCARPPCAPVPKCLLNPCPSGSPMKLSNGVTGLCRESLQCWDGYWCHQVGYNGLGFCCPLPQVRSHRGACTARMSVTVHSIRTNHQSNCSSECRSDEECPSPGKCCFDGCGLKCIFDFGTERAVDRIDSSTGDDRNTINDATEEHKSQSAVQTANKELLATYPKLAKCPAESRLRAMRRQRSECNECHTDADCPGLQLCCSVMVREERSSAFNASECHICVYSQSTTKCLHEAITHDFYGRREIVGGILTLPPRCAAPFGDYAPVQCNAKYCFCVDKLNGIEISGTRKSLEEGPLSVQQCERRSNPHNACPLRRCGNVESCASGEFVRDDKGCATCECMNTCANLQCQSDEVCVLAKVDCVGTYCTRQPRCITNFCPNGERPLATSSSTAEEEVAMTVAVEQCSSECPVGYRCRHVGLPGEGGICCPEPTATVNSADVVDNSLEKCQQQSILLLSRNNGLCATECHTNADCNGLARCCFNGCGARCVISEKTMDVIRPETTKRPISRTFMTSSQSPADDSERPGECAIPRSRVYRAPSGDRCMLQNTLLSRHRAHGVATLRPTCTRDLDCPSSQKCCLEACTGRRQCQFAHKNTACLHLKSAYLESGAGDLAMNLRCTNRHFAPVQCDSSHCWCVDEAVGNEIEGTRVESPQTPNCQEPQKCSGRRCTTKVCIHGFEKDENGCDTCECANPCKRLKCPEKLGLICIPEKVECLFSNPSIQCPYVPKCVPNVCASESATGADAILIRKGTFRPETCQKSSNCPPDYHCRQLGGRGGVCCFGQEPAQRSGRCPVLHDWALGYVEPEFCELQCSNDASCPNRSEKCCFNGCGLSCMPSIHADPREVQHSETQPVNSVAEVRPPDRRPQFGGSKPGECPLVETNTVPCSTKLASQFESCSNDSDCVDTQKCCAVGCEGALARICQFPAVSTRCQHSRAAAMLILKAHPNNIFMPKCTPNGDFEELQRHNGVAWCVDPKTGREVHGSKSTALLLVSCFNNLRAKSCPILACSLDCPYGFETDLLGCQLCACKNPCRDVRCGPNQLCQMIKVTCTDENDPQCSLFVPRCTLNACPTGEPLQDATSHRFFQCDERSYRSCPVGWFCHAFGLGDSSGYCCSGSVSSLARLRSKRCPNVAPILAINDGTSAPPFVSFSRAYDLPCRTSDDCRTITNGGSCCFNGRDTSCVALSKDSEDDNAHPDDTFLFGHINDHVEVKDKEKYSIGICPANVLQTTDCRSDCSSDLDCQRRDARKRCCAFGCARRCLLAERQRDPDGTCLQMLTAIIREADKLFPHDGRENGGVNDTAADRVAHFVAQNEVQCASDGTFKPIQCNNRLRQCWCVNVETGAETPGTRTNISAAATLNCRQPRPCHVNCAREQKNCPHGIRLDVSGCPINGACVCARPCDRFTCARSGDICILQEPSSKCGISSDCKARPECIPNPCGNRSRVANLDEPQTCSNDEDCDAKAKCEFRFGQQSPGICCHNSDEIISPEGADAIAVTLSPSRDAGVCPGDLGVNDETNRMTLPAGEFGSPIQPAILKLYEQKQTCTVGNECDSDSDCADSERKSGAAKKCCTVGGSSRCRRRACVQPFRATNCVNTLAAIMELQRRHILHNLYTPYCDTQNGNYRSNQCDDSEGWCWCVDVTTGRPILGTRTLQPTFDVCTLTKQHRPRCEIKCDNESRCPFGVEMNKNGCPRSAQCRCRSPCVDVRCARGEICLMRSRPCQEETCLPVPVCEANPCHDKHAPLKAQNLGEGALMSCSVSRENFADSDLILACPVNHYCTAADENGIGICCAGKESNVTSINKSSVQVESMSEAKISTAGLIAACLDSKPANALPNLANYFRNPSLIVDGASYSNEADWEPRNVRCDNDLQCAKTHFCGRSAPKEKGICCPSSQFICQQSMNAGYSSKNITGCNGQTSARFYFDKAINSCMQFIYGGCGGNLNNFLSNSDCEAFCLGNPLHNASAAERKAENTIYTVGFVMQGPPKPVWTQNDNELRKFQMTVRDYVKSNLGDTIKDVHVAKNGTIALAFSSEDGTAARRVAQSAIDTITAGEFRLRYHNALYSAVPDTVFNRQSNPLSGDKFWSSSESDALFWIITMAALLFALAIIIIVCSIYNCLRTRARSRASTRGDSASPTSYQSRTSPQTRVTMNTQRIEHPGTYSAAATIASTSRRLKVVSLPHQPQTHLLTISNYNHNSRQVAGDEARIGISRYAPSQLLLTPALPKKMRAPPPPPAAVSSASTSSAEADPRFLPQSRTLKRDLK